MSVDPVGSDDSDELAAKREAREKAAEEAKQKAIKEFRSAQLARMNREIAVLNEPIGHMLVEGDPDDGGKPFQLAKKAELEIKYANVAHAPKAGYVTTWLKWRGRREFSRIVFEPDQSSGKHYNLWHGFGIEPRQKDISLFWDDLVLDTICAGNKSKYDYLRKWMAFGVQRPRQMPGTAPLLHGKQGIGKSTIVTQWLKPIYARHFFEATSLDTMLGTFNSHLANAMLVFGNEAIWGGDVRMEGRLKSLITDPISEVTQKFHDTIQVSNYKRWIFASNADHPIPVGNSNRRFAVYEVSADKRGDYEFWNKLSALKADGGVAGLMYDLLNEPLARFHPERDLPTDGIGPYKIASSSPLIQWLHDTLSEAEIKRQDQRHDCYLPWDGFVPKAVMYDSYCAFARSRNKTIEPSAAFWRKLKLDIGVVESSDVRPRSGDTDRPRSALLKHIVKARDAFCVHMNDEGGLFPFASLSQPPAPCQRCARYESGSAFDNGVAGP